MPLVVSDLRLDAACGSVPEGVAKQLAANPIDLVLNERSERLPRSLDYYAEYGRASVCFGRGCQLLPRRSEQSVQVAIDGGISPQILNCIPALNNRARRILETIVQHFGGAIDSRRKQIARCLENRNKALNTLQEAYRATREPRAGAHRLALRYAP